MKLVKELENVNLSKISRLHNENKLNAINEENRLKLSNVAIASKPTQSPKTYNLRSNNKN